MKSFAYLPHTEGDRSVMLDRLGMRDAGDLFAYIPPDIRLDRPLRLPPELGEWELLQDLRALANRNLTVDDAVSLLGAGAYNHFIPSAVEAIVGRSEFYTSYTPYQPEMSQGMLQATYEYQSLVAELLGLDAANASLYDGATAVGEAAAMACAHTRRNKVLVSATVHPEYRAVLRTYARGQRIEVRELGALGHALRRVTLEEAIADDCAAVVVQYPNFFGSIEDVRAFVESAHAVGALLIVSANPIALGILEAPGRLGADIAVAEGQPLGNALGFGGPYLGVMAAAQPLVRRLPGRIAGQTKDRAGRRGFVLTLQAREQHIRREKASSNICSNQALNALAAAVYLSCMGPRGLREVARQCFDNAHYAAARFSQAGFPRSGADPFYHEFVLPLGPRAVEIRADLLRHGILPGLELGEYDPELAGNALVAFTELTGRAQIDAVAKRLEAWA